jgi:hypothetical protein
MFMGGNPVGDDRRPLLFLFLFLLIFLLSEILD